MKWETMVCWLLQSTHSIWGCGRR